MGASAKKSKVIIAFMLLAFNCHTYAMEPESNEVPINFPPEVNYHIIDIFTQIKSNTTLQSAINTIHSLAVTNKEMNQLVNDPKLCLLIIKNLSKQFNRSNEVVAQRLNTKEARHRLGIQKLFEGMIEKDAFNKNNFDTLYNLYKNYVDLNFTYTSTLPATNPSSKSFNPQIDYKRTLLLITRQLFDQNNNKDGAAKLKWLLNTKKIEDINIGDTFGMTILMTCALKAQPEIVKFLCEYPRINLNKRHQNGETALMFLCELFGVDKFNLENMKILINAGADPEIPTKQGITPLQAVGRNNNQEAINLIKQAIQKKYEKK